MSAAVENQATLRFPKEVYPGELVDQASKVYAKFGGIELESEEDAWLVHVSASSAARLSRLMGEIGNYALGLTIEQRRLEAEPSDQETGGSEDASSNVGDES